MRLAYIFMVLLFCLPALGSRQSRCHSVFRLKPLIVQPARKHVQKGPGEFIVIDLLNKDFFWKAYLREGVLSMWVQLEVPAKGYRSSLKGHELYKEMMEHFGKSNISKIESVWKDQKNFTQFFKNVGAGMGESEAALHTWSGRQAQRYGFSEAQVEIYQNPLNLTKIIMVEFRPTP